MYVYVCVFFFMFRSLPLPGVGFSFIFEGDVASQLSLPVRYPIYLLYSIRLSSPQDLSGLYSLDTRVGAFTRLNHATAFMLSGSNRVLEKQSSLRYMSSSACCRLEPATFSSLAPGLLMVSWWRVLIGRSTLGSSPPLRLNAHLPVMFHFPLFPDSRRPMLYLADGEPGADDPSA